MYYTGMACSFRRLLGSDLTYDLGSLALVMTLLLLGPDIGSAKLLLFTYLQLPTPFLPLRLPLWLPWW
jgi:hypothetical protein